MGVFAESIAEYAQPLIDQTNGDMEQINKAMAHCSSMLEYCNLAGRKAAGCCFYIRRL